MRKVVALLAGLLLVASAFVAINAANDAEPADAASSIFGIHIARHPGEQAWLKISKDQLATSWRPYFDDAALIISNASPWVVMTTTGCTSAYPCAVPKLKNFSPSSPWIQIIYDLAGDHLFNFTGGLHRQDVGINGNKPASVAQKKAVACDALMRTVGVADGCGLDGWPNSEGLAILAFMHTHDH